MPNRKFGYAYVAAPPGNLDHQIEHLRTAGSTEIFSDKGKGGDSQNRPGLKSLLAVLQPGDTVVVCDIK